MQRFRSFTEGSITRRLINFALPIFFANVLQTLNGSVNAVWVGRYLGEAALAATSIANTVMFLLIGAALGVAIAATILVGQCVGAGKLREAKRAVGTSVTFFATISLGFSVAGLTLSRPLLALMKTPAASFPLAVAYMRVIFLALPSLYMYASVMSVLRGSGDSKTPLYFILVSVAIDISLNPVFIFGFGPIPRLGIAGSALATVVAQTVTLVALVIHLYRRRHPLCLDKSELSMLRVDWAIVGTLVRKGIPMSGHILVLSFSGVLMITLVNRFGVDTAAAYGASIQLWNYIPMPAAAVAAAASTMAAQNVGAQKWDRVESIARVGVAYSILGTGCMVLAMEILDAHAFELFMPAGSEALHIASHINRVVTWSWVLAAVSMVLFGVTRATGAVMAPLLIAILTVLVVQFPLAKVLLDRWQADAIWWSFPISLAIEVVLAGLYYKYGGWRTAQLEIPVPIEALSTDYIQPRWGRPR
jgi:putative MATE family efflux protein